MDLNGQKYIILHEFKWQRSGLDMSLTANVYYYLSINYVKLPIVLLPVFDYDFLADCFSLMHGIGINCVQHIKVLSFVELFFLDIQ